MEALVAAGCDTALGNDSGLTGWELAAELQRGDMEALRGKLEPAVVAGGSRKDGKSRSKKISKQKKRSPRPSKSESGGGGSGAGSAAAAPSPAPAATPAGRTVVL